MELKMNLPITHSQSPLSLIHSQQDVIVRIASFSDPDTNRALSLTSTKFRKGVLTASEAALKKLIVHPFFTFHGDPLESRRVYQIDSNSPLLQQVAKCISILSQVRKEYKLEGNPIFPIHQFDEKYREYRHECFKKFKETLSTMNPTLTYKTVNIERLSNLDPDTRGIIFSAAAQENYWELINMLIDQGVVPFNLNLKIDIERLSDLHPNIIRIIFSAAVQENYWEIINMLMDQGVEIPINLNIIDYEDTALHFACTYGRIEMVRLLIHVKGVNLFTLNEEFYTLLHAAAAGSKPAEILRILVDLNKLDLNAQDVTGWTPLHHASEKESDDALKILLDAGADCNLQDENGCSALHFVTNEEHLNMTEILLNANSSHNIQHMISLTSEYLKQKKQALNKVQLLLNAGINPNIQDEHEKTALHLTVTADNLDKIKTLLDENITLHPFYANQWTLLHAELKATNLSIVKTLLRAGTDPNILDHYGQTALHLAIKAKNPDMVDVLLNAGVDPNIQDQNEWTALHTAIITNFNPIISLLLKVDNIDFDLQTNIGSTALHLAVEYQNKELVRYFIKKGINFSQQIIPATGETILDSAATTGELPEILEMLVNALLQTKEDVFSIDDKKKWIEQALDLVKQNQASEDATGAFAEIDQEMCRILSEAKSQLLT